MIEKSKVTITLIKCNQLFSNILTMLKKWIFHTIKFHGFLSHFLVSINFLCRIMNFISSTCRTSFYNWVFRQNVKFEISWFVTQQFQRIQRWAVWSKLSIETNQNGSQLFEIIARQSFWRMQKSWLVFGLYYIAYIVYMI